MNYTSILYLQSGAKLLGHFSCNSASRFPHAMLRSKIVLQNIALTIGPNIAWREGEGMKYLAILELRHKIYILPHKYASVVHVHLIKIREVSQSILHKIAVLVNKSLG